VPLQGKGREEREFLCQKGAELYWGRGKQEQKNGDGPEGRIKPRGDKFTV